MACSGDEVLKSTAYMTEWALPEKCAAIVTVHTDANSEGTVSGRGRYATPLNVAFNTQLGLFSWFELPGNESRFRRFGHAMVGTRQYEIKKEVLRGMDTLC